ncbi:hypothetical protein ACFOGJ_14030 [Marinibaculum pumilum]|uniref:Lipoprotein n=1 Tax=Marinibaculum pumilum TaxID=1766165 RepID=A0ABV7L183_9PROT
MTTTGTRRSTRSRPATTRPAIRMAATLTAIALAAGTAACGGRDPRHIPVVEPNDTALSCQALSALIANNNYRIESLFAEHKRASESNVAIGVAGALLFWPVLFALDTSDAERVEAQQLSDRNVYLASVAQDKDCQGTREPVEIKFDEPPPPAQQEANDSGAPR